MYHHYEFTLIYRPLSYPFRSLNISLINKHLLYAFICSCREIYYSWLCFFFIFFLILNLLRFSSLFNNSLFIMIILKSSLRVSYKKSITNYCEIYDLCITFNYVLGKNKDDNIHKSKALKC